MKNNRMLISVYTVICLTLLTCCTNAPLAVTPAPTVEAAAAPTITENPNFPDLEPITPENVHRLEILDTLGVGQIFDVAISPDQKTLAVYTPMKIYLYDTTTFNETGTINVDQDNNDIKVVCFSPDGKYLAYSSSNELIFWNIDKGFEEDKINVLPGTEIIEVLFSPDSKQIIISTFGTFEKCSGDGQHIELYNLQGKYLFGVEDCALYPYYQYFENNKAVIIIDGLETYVMNKNNGSLLASSVKRRNGITGKSEIVTMAKELLPSGEVIASLRKKEEGFLKNSITEKICRMDENQYPYDYFPIYTDQNNAIYLFTKNSKIQTIDLINLSDCKLKKQLTYASSSQIALSPDGKFIASSNGFDTTIWNIEELMIQFEIRGKSMQHSVEFLQFSKNGDQLLSGSRVLFSSDLESSGLLVSEFFVSLWDTQTGELIRERKLVGREITELIATPDINFIIANQAEGLIIWNIETGQQIDTLPSPGSQPSKIIAFSEISNSIYIFQPNYDKPSDIILEYNYKTGVFKRVLYTNLSHGIVELKIIDDGSKMLLVQEIYLNYAILDLDTDRIIWNSSYNHYFREIYSMSNNLFSFDKATFIPSFDQNNPEIRIPGSYFDTIQTPTMVISHDSQNFAFWDLSNNNYLGEYSTSFKISEIAFSPDGYHLIMTDTNGILYIRGVKKE